jgi:hypothetical protein
MAKRDTTTTKVLRKALKLIDTPDKWTRGVVHRKEKGQDLYCSVGAIQEAANELNMAGEYYAASKVINNVLPKIAEEGEPSLNIITFNDYKMGARKATRHPRIVKAFKEAIKASRVSV